MEVKQVVPYIIFIHSYSGRGGLNWTIIFTYPDYKENGIGGFRASGWFGPIVSNFYHSCEACRACACWTWITPWILLTIAIMIGSIVFLARVFKPTLKTYGTHKFHKERFIKNPRKATWQ